MASASFPNLDLIPDRPPASADDPLVVLVDCPAGVHGHDRRPPIPGGNRALAHHPAHRGDGPAAARGRRPRRAKAVVAPRATGMEAAASEEAGPSKDRSGCSPLEYEAGPRRIPAQRSRLPPSRALFESPQLPLHGAEHDPAGHHRDAADQEQWVADDHHGLTSGGASIQAHFVAGALVGFRGKHQRGPHGGRNR